MLLQYHIGSHEALERPSDWVWLIEGAQGEKSLWLGQPWVTSVTAGRNGYLGFGGLNTHPVLTWTQLGGKRKEHTTKAKGIHGNKGKQGTKWHLNLGGNTNTVLPRFATDGHMLTNITHFHSFDSKFIAGIFCEHGNNIETSHYFLW